ncbi:hypothetical protein DXB70_04270 [Clostridium sp. OM05-5BH]|nr:hypothetical protein DXB70_04270 [Clostridium sp. OM05-5BH]
MKQKNAPRGCALARSRNMSQATALGARMCQGTFFFMRSCIQKSYIRKTFQSQLILLLKIKEILQFRAKAPNFAKFFR